MTPYTPPQQRTSFLSSTIKAVVRKRLIEFCAIILWIIASVLLISMLSFNTHDPSFNKISAQPPINILGLFGSYTSDVLLQYMGLGGSAFILILVTWGWKLLSQHALKNFYLKLSLALFFVVVGCLFFSLFQASQDWPFGCGLGGCIGWWLNNLVQPAITDYSFLSGILCLITLATLFIYIADIPWSMYRRLMRAVFLGSKNLLRRIFRAFYWLIKKTAALFNHEKPALTEASSSSTSSVTTLRKADAVIRRPLTAMGIPSNTTIANSPNRPAEQQQQIVLNQPKPELSASAASIKAAAVPPQESKPDNKPVRRKLFAKSEKTPPAPKKSSNSNLPSFDLPPLDLLAPVASNEKVQKVNVEGLEKNARQLETILNDFGVQGDVVNVRPGPVVTLYELEPAPGTKTSRVIGLADDIARSMSAVSVRIAVVPGRSVIGIEMPNPKREMVSFRELLGHETYAKSTASLALALGKDIGGSPMVVDLAKMPHLLIAGTTGSGKSVAINTMILSLLYRLSPDQCKFIMIDPKMLELSVYDDIPHLLSPVVTDPKKAIVALKWTVREMETRYRAMSKLGVRNIGGYNERITSAQKSGETLTHRVQTGFDPATGKPIFEEEPFDLSPLPFIVVVVDEMADLMLVAGKEIEAAIQRLAQMARAAGIHIIMATQRPSVDVITGTIKANFPTRISFHVTSRIDSRTILGEQGAEQLLGQGDMLYMGQGGKITRVHGPFVSDQEVEKIVRFLKEQGVPNYIQEITEEEQEAEDASDMGDASNSGDDLYDQAVALVLREKKASTSFIQRHLQIGYNRAARIIETMEKQGVVGPANHVGKREVLGRSTQGDEE